MLASVVTGIAIFLFGVGGSNSHPQKQQPKMESVQFLASQSQLNNLQTQSQLNNLQNSVDQLRTQQQIQQGYDAMNRNSSGSWIAPTHQYWRP